MAVRRDVDDTRHRFGGAGVGSRPGLPAASSPPASPADGCVSGLGARISRWWIGIDSRDLHHAGEGRRHCGVHRRIDANRDVGHLNAAQHIADLAYVARHEEAGVTSAQVLREIGEHLRPGDINRRAGLGVQNNGPRVRGLGDPADPGAHMFGVGEGALPPDSGHGVVD
jgi:hypothetical protein